MTGEKKKQFLFHDLTILWLPIDNLLIKSRKFGGKSYYCYSGVLLFRCFLFLVSSVMANQGSSPVICNTLRNKLRAFRKLEFFTSC